MPRSSGHEIDAMIRALVTAFPPHRVEDRPAGAADVMVGGLRVGGVFPRADGWAGEWDFPGSRLRRLGVRESTVIFPQPTAGLAALEVAVTHVRSMAAGLLPRDVALGEREIGEAALQRLLAGHGLLSPASAPRREAVGGDIAPGDTSEPEL